MRRLAAAAVVVAVGALGASAAGAEPARDALIRPGVSIGELRLGMTFDAVRTALGRHTEVVERRRLGFGSTYVEYGWSARTWRVGLLGRGAKAKVVKVATSIRRERTRSGVGVGSTIRALQRRLGARCWGAHDNVRYGARLCYVGRRGQAKTVFQLQRACALPPGSYYVCPEEKLDWVIYEVEIAEPAILPPELR